MTVADAQLLEWGTPDHDEVAVGNDATTRGTRRNPGTGNNEKRKTVFSCTVAAHASTRKRIKETQKTKIIKITFLRGGSSLWKTPHGKAADDRER